MRIAVDGVDLVDRVRVIEQPFADAEGKPDLAGDYCGLWWRESTDAGELLGHYLGRPDQALLYDDRVQLLACRCGEPGCWPLACHIEATGTVVRWLNFVQPYRDGHRKPPQHPGLWRYDQLGPFTFDRRRYEESLLAAVDVLQNWSSSHE